MSHDINNMNQVAIGFIELALEHIDLEGSLSRGDKHLLEKPIDALRNSARLIDNVKKLQRIRKGGLRMMPVDIGQALDDAISELSRNNGREISIRRASAKGYYVTANELLKDVFSNVIGNSIRHSRADQPLHIDITVDKQTIDSTDHYVVSIEDNGPGICDSRKEAIFDRFELYKNHTLSSGFGLSLVKALADAYHGKAWIEDRIAGDHTKGCRFVIALPVLKK
jgi:signal transduction histidine kinase